jgi:HlyD family secretion protein
MLANLPSRVRTILLVVIALAAAGGAVWYYLVQPALASTADLTASGNIEARTVRLAPEVSARVISVEVDQGQSVTAGQVVLKLDDSSLQAQYGQARAALATAQANLALLKAGPAPEQRAMQVAQAEAALVAAQNGLKDLQDNAALATAQAQADVANAQKALDTAKRNLSYIVAPDLTYYQNRVDDAQNALTNGQQGNTQIDIGAYFAQLKAAQDLVDKLNERLGKIQAAIDGCPTCDPKRYVTVDRIPQTLAQAKDDYNGALNHLHDLQLQKDQSERSNATSIRDAQKRLDDAKRNLADAQKAAEGSPNAYDLGVAKGQVAVAQAAVDKAQAHYERVKAGPDPEKLAVAQAQLAAAQAALAAAKSGPSAEQVAVAQAQVDAAQAQMDAIQVQLKKYVLTAPTDGVVLSRSIEPGEFTAPGATLFEIGHLDTLEVTVYIPEEKYALLHLGQQATVKVDAYPTRTFTATVTQLADQAEFTPRNVQTVAGRKDTVYAVQLSIANGDLALKAGMPADVSFGKK